MCVFLLGIADLIVWFRSGACLLFHRIGVPRRRVDSSFLATCWTAGDSDGAGVASYAVSRPPVRSFKVIFMCLMGFCISVCLMFSCAMFICCVMFLK
jgi:hypothetical protein